MVTFYLELNTNVSCQADNFFSQFNIVLFVYPNVRTVAFNPMPTGPTRTLPNPKKPAVS